MPSDIFLTNARDRVLQQGGRIEHVDVTLICEQPKISPHREKMCNRIAEILNIEPEHVSIKATINMTIRHARFMFIAAPLPNPGDS